MRLNNVAAKRDGMESRPGKARLTSFRAQFDNAKEKSDQHQQTARAFHLTAIRHGPEWVARLVARRSSGALRRCSTSWPWRAPNSNLPLSAVSGSAGSMFS